MERENKMVQLLLLDDALYPALNEHPEHPPAQPTLREDVQQKQSSTNNHCSHSNLINIPLMAPATIYSSTNSDTTKPLNITSSQLKIAHLNCPLIKEYCTPYRGQGIGQSLQN